MMREELKKSERRIGNQQWFAEKDTEVDNKYDKAKEKYISSDNGITLNVSTMHKNHASKVKIP